MRGGGRGRSRGEGTLQSRSEGRVLWAAVHHISFPTRNLTMQQRAMKEKEDELSEAEAKLKIATEKIEKYR